MPSQFKPYYPPGTLRSHFSTEQVLTRPLYTLRVVFPPESPHFPTSLRISPCARDKDQHTIPGLERNTPFNSTEPHSDVEPINFIPKPNGEAGRPSNGYNLKQYCTNEQSRICWSETQFVDAQVSPQQY
jgi:hypothetical protein